MIRHRLILELDRGSIQGSNYRDIVKNVSQPLDYEKDTEVRKKNEFTGISATGWPLAAAHGDKIIEFIPSSAAFGSLGFAIANLLPRRFGDDKGFTMWSESVIAPSCLSGN